MENRAYYSSISFKYDQTIADLWGGSLRRCQDNIRSLLNLVHFSSDDVVMDIAAGTGIASEVLLEKSVKHLYLVDNCCNMLERAEFKLGKYPTEWKFIGKKWEQREELKDDPLFYSRYYLLRPIDHVYFILHDAYDIDNPKLELVSSTFVNKIVLANAFSSFTNPQRLLQAVYNRLQYGGYFLCTNKVKPEIKCPPSLREIIRDNLAFIMNETTDKEPTHSQQEIKNMIQDAGFTLIYSSEENVFVSSMERQLYFQGTVNRVRAILSERNEPYGEILSPVDWVFSKPPATEDTFYLRTEGYFIAQKQ